LNQFLGEISYSGGDFRVGSFRYDFLNECYEVPEFF